MNSIKKTGACIVLAIAVLIVPQAIFGEEKIGLTITPYAAMNIGNVVADGFEPVFQFDTIGVAATYDIALGDAGKVTPGIEDYAMVKFDDPLTWLDTLELSVAYAIGDFGIKASLPLLLAGDPEQDHLVTNFYLQPSYKIKIAAPMSLTVDMKTLFYVFDVPAKNDDSLRLEPRAKFCYGDFYVMARMNLFVPSFNNIEFLAYVGYTIANISPELSVKLTNINPLNPDTEIGVIPYFKLSYKISL